MDDLSIMYLVVRKDHSASLEELLVASAQATIAVMDFANDGDYSAEFNYWRRNLYGKIMLRADAKQAAKLTEFTHGTDDHGLVHALPPRRKSAREKLLTQLQVYTAECDALPSRPVTIDIEPAPVLPILVNANVPMSAGKLAAQVGHAAMLAVERFRDEVAMEWKRSARQIVVLKCSEWNAFKGGHSTVVRDAGLTEIAEGSETVMALAPAKWSAFPEAVRALPRI